MIPDKTHRVTKVILFISMLLCLVQCKPDKRSLFVSIPPDKSGIDFSNTITESDSFNILTNEYIYNGGGVAIADFNNDGLQDLFFTGNQVSNRIYLNKGAMKFEDVTDKTLVNVPGRWNSGAVVVDINNDGWRDIYVCATMHGDAVDRGNMLFLNKGANGQGIPAFEEVAASYGIADSGHSTMAAFFDYDRDGDLDLYILTNQLLKDSPSNYRMKVNDGSSLNNDRLYRNEGNGTFTDVTVASGVVYEGFGLGLAISDINLDGWPDIYVSNDFISNDLLYINNQDGTFTNKVSKLIDHQSHSSMGNDIADFNNDAMPDIITLDMLPEVNHRKKTTINNKSYLTYINNEKYGYDYQYVRNMLHQNNGAQYDLPFSEIGQLAGVHQTEWSWSPLFADFDNDGLRDLFITNGFPKDITDKDFSNYRDDVGAYVSVGALTDSIPPVEIPNYAFKNNGDLTFTDVTTEWGFDLPSFSNGAAFADLDNDGDLDYVVNNINSPAFIFENKLYQKDQADTCHYLQVKLQGPSSNAQGIGTKLFVYLDSTRVLYAEHQLVRGYLSSVSEVVHFGLGKKNQVDSLEVIWPNGAFQIVKNVPVDQVLILKFDASSGLTQQVSRPGNFNTIFSEAPQELGLAHFHQEEDRIDFNIQRTLPHKFSQSGPGIAVGDINGDDRDDVIIGGSVDNYFSIFTQQADGGFRETKRKGGESKKQEDQGLLLFDADGDDDLDLYVVSGGIESEPNSVDYQDRLFRNDGRGTFELDYQALPKLTSSGSCVRAADFDADGDLDLFVGGRVIPGSYPYAPQSYLLLNQGGRFTDATSSICEEMRKIGMVTDAIFTDFNNDNLLDLIVVGEFMPVTFFRNEKSKFVNVTSGTIAKRRGWWNSIAAADFDNDGDIDYVAGNLGVNNGFKANENHPLTICAKDFDQNGSIDAVLSCYTRRSFDGHEKDLYPIHFWDELNTQSPKFRKQFANYKAYAAVTLDKLFTPEDLEGALTMTANYFHTSLLINNGSETFEIKQLPARVQFAPVNGIVTTDVNGDGHIDIVMAGNDYGNEVFVGRYDAFKGAVLIGDGKGNFDFLPASESGFLIEGDAKSLVTAINSKGDRLFIASRNQDSLKVFFNSKQTNLGSRVFSPQTTDVRAEVIRANGQKQIMEFYYGSAYLSQSTRKAFIPHDVKSMVVYDSQGKTREVTWQK